MSARARGRSISVAGICIIALGAGAAFMPAGKTISSDMIGAVLIAAGLIETIAGSLRTDVRNSAMAAGIVTSIAGLLFILNPETHLFPIVWPIVGWLVIRGALLGYAASHASGSVRTWIMLSAGMDLLLAVLLVAGLSVSTIIVSIFGPTPELVASFAWILAASFVVNGLMLLEVASCERATGAAA
jgi:uncharacterized membrane protein HdeD (DUF308 family)